MIDSLRRRRGLLIGIGAALVLLVCVTLSSYRGFANFTEMSSSVEHTFNVLVTLQSLSSQLKDAETGQRGYLLTGKESYLEPYSTSISELQADIDRLHQLTSQSPSQQKRLSELIPVVQEKLAEMKLLIDIRKAQGLPAALERINGDKGKLLMDRIRTILSIMTEEENRVLAERNTAAVGSSQQIALLTSGFATLLMVLMGGMITALIREVAARQAAENAVKHGESVFRLLVSNVVDYAIMMLDSQGKVRTWNAGAERIIGYSDEDITGEHISQFYLPEDVEAGKPARELEIATREGKFEDTGWRVRKDGSRFYANVVVTALRDEAGELQGFAKITRDITERKRAEDELLRSKEELELLNIELSNARDAAQAASKFKSQFVANMSHEIRTPMNGIIGMCNVLLKSGLTERQHSFATSIKDAGNALLTVINDILDFSKIEAGKLELEIEEFEPVRLVESACEILASQARAKHLSLMSYVDPAIPQRLRGDAERLRQVLLNLTANAIKFSEKGEIVVSATVESRQGNVCNIKFSITDRGIGLNEDEQRRLFQPFVQADGSISRKYGGTGLGLSISKRLVELMDGTIGVESSPGTGAHFWFVIPLEVRSNTAAQTLKEELANVRVLIVDDEPNARQILQSYVGSWGMRNGVANNAEDGLRMLREAVAEGDPYRVAVIDLLMPAKNGIEMASEIMQDPSLSITKLILLTGFDTAGLGTQAIELGFKAYITKPVRQSQMLDCLIGIVCGGVAKNAKVALEDEAGRAHSRPELILIVEDHPINQQVAQLYLDELGFPCHIASNGAEAIEAVRAEAYALVLMDCQMPVMDGLQAASAIRRAESHTGKRLPIIAMTAHAMQGDRERCIGAGMDDYLTKPLDPVELRNAIHRWLPRAVDTNGAENTVPHSPLRTNGGLVDLAEFDSRYGTRSDGLLQMFVDDAPVQIRYIEQAMGEHDVRELQQRVHSLKGTSATIQAKAINQVCKEIEVAMRENDWDLLTALVRKLHEEFEATQDYLQKSNRL